MKHIVSNGIKYFVIMKFYFLEFFRGHDLSYQNLKQGIFFLFGLLCNKVKNNSENIKIIEGAKLKILWGNKKSQVLNRVDIQEQLVVHLPKKIAHKNVLKILTLNTMAHGGAGTGSIRRIEALRSIGVDARLLSLISKYPNEYIGRIIPTLEHMDSTNHHNVWYCLMRNIKRNITNLRGFKSQEFFSLTDSVVDIRQLTELINNVDIVHLHWIVGMLDYKNITKVMKDIPIVWTTADMNPFTGGCHYSEGCDGFTRDCSNCPMVSDETDLPHQVWKLKQKVYASLNINIVCPSEYIANMVRKSSLLKNKSIHVIPNAYPIDRLKPTAQIIEARKRLNLPLDKKLVMVAAVSLNNFRKGSDLFSQVAKKLACKINIKELEFITIGRDYLTSPFKVHNIGTVKEEKLVLAYSAVNVFISLSREDVGPMTVVESLLCGTPVVGFNIGVLPDVVLHKKTGVCAEPFNVDEIVEGIMCFLNSKNSQQIISKTCRESAVKYADPKLSANRHKELYEKILN